MNRRKPIIKIGDWVHSYSKGIWRIFKIIPRPNDHPYDKTVTPDNFLVFSSRFLNSKGKPQFETEAVSDDWIFLLSSEEELSLNNYISQNPKEYSKFIERPPKKLKAICNIPLSLPSKMNVTFSNEAMTHLKMGLNYPQILELLKMEGLFQYYNVNPRNKTLQFVCHDYRIENNEMIYQFEKFLDF